MCLILRHSLDNPISLADVDDVYWRNKDGYGAIWRGADGIARRTRYLPQTAKAAADVYRDAVALAARHGATEIVHHWRMATHGTVSRDNVHPFRVGRGAYLVHNGIAPGLGRGVQSDTAHLASLLAERTAGLGVDDVAAYLAQADVLAWVRSTIGGSRVVIATSGPDGAIHTVDDGSSVVHQGRWYSNEYAWSAPKRTYTYTRTWRDADPDTATTCDLQPGVLAHGVDDAALVLADLLADIGDDGMAATCREVADGRSPWGADAVDWLLGEACRTVSDCLDDYIVYMDGGELVCEDPYAGLYGHGSDGSTD